MAKERARRRAEREAAQAQAQARRLVLERRRARRRALMKRLRPKTRRWAWGFGRRSPAQRSLVIGIGVAALLAIWYFLDGWPARIALSLLVLLALPVVAVLTFDRKGMRL
jgi:hypothetical protein